MVIFYIFLFVQVVLESLPVSTSGHIDLIIRLLHQFDFDFFVSLNRLSFLYDFIFTKDVFFHFLHGPTLFVLAYFFSHRWLVMALHPWRCRKIIYKIIKNIFVANTITTMLYIFFSFFGKDWFFLGYGFLISVFLLYSLRWCQDTNQKKVTMLEATFLGLVQGLALLPGISRLGVVFVIARWFKISKRHAFEFAWLIQYPLIVVAWLHSLAVLHMTGFLSEILTPGFLFAIAVATGGALATLYLSYYLIQKNLFWVISIYLIVPSVIACLL